MARAENKENYEDLLKKIDGLGSIREVINNENLLNQIIAYNGDRHLLCALFDRVNEGIKNEDLLEDDLTLFRNGTLINSIINLDEVAKQYCGRIPFTSERLDKIMYISTINDNQTKATSYTHPQIIDALCDEGENDLTGFVRFATYYSLPEPVKSAIISSILDRGNIEVAQSLINGSKRNLKSYDEINNTNTKSL